MKRLRGGFTLIELLVALSVLGILMLVLLFTYPTQLAKSKDTKRKSDLVKLQQALEDYLSDNICYPENLNCGQNFSPYLSSVPCDPVNSGVHIYFYSVSQESDCKKWYKIFTSLENKNDPVIEKIGCSPTTCGPFNYVVSSSNAELLVKQPGEVIP